MSILLCKSRSGRPTPFEGKMETITEQKLREMEAEMSRFEEEISVPKCEDEIDGECNAQKTIIGARTYHQVKAQLEHRHSDMAPQYPVSMPLSMGITCSAPPKLLPPPPPPLGLRPPPPGGLPPARPPPSFVPPQLRGRSLPSQPRPFAPITGMPHTLPSNMAVNRWPSGEMSMPRPPPPPGYLSDHMLQSPGYHMHEVTTNSGSHAQISASPVIEKPKVVYSAPPVRNKVAKKTKTKAAASVTHTKLSTGTTAEVDSSCSQTGGVAPGIEVNIPMEKIEAERVGLDTAAVGGNQDEAEILEGDTIRKEKKAKKRKFVRMAAGEIWEDPTLAEWEPDDFRMFCGDLGNEVTDETLVRAFSRYPSFVKARVVRDKKTNKTKGYGFASFRDPNDFVKAMREMNGKYVGNRPIKLRKSCWRDRQAEIVKKKEKEKKRLGFR